MSKWTLEKILACNEIKFGTMFKFDDEDEFLVLLRKGTFGISFIDSTQTSDGWDQGAIKKYDFQFFNHGTEILPPKNKKKIKNGFWVRVYPHGFGQVIYKDKEEAMDFGNSAIACEYFEREVEVEE